ncbi:MAG: DUF1059 domain-containing protein [Betaproteobacteria bacterium]|nr:DUF1059 domain-containing protein [Betaproteobacteria bacterium]
MARKFVKCDCGFVMRAADDDSLVAEVQKHASEEHQMTLTRDQVLAMAQPDQGTTPSSAGPGS